MNLARSDTSRGGDIFCGISGLVRQIIVDNGLQLFFARMIFSVYVRLWLLLLLIFSSHSYILLEPNSNKIIILILLITE